MQLMIAKRRVNSAVRRAYANAFRSNQKVWQRQHAIKRMAERSVDDYEYFEEQREKSQPVKRESKTRTWYHVRGSDDASYYLLFNKREQVIITIYTEAMFFENYPEFFEDFLFEQSLSNHHSESPPVASHPRAWDSHRSR